MNQTELLQAVIASAVKEGVRDALEKELAPLKEELKQIKALNAKILKEQANIKSSAAPLQEQTGTFRPIPRPNTAITEGQKRMELDKLKAMAAPFADNVGENLPDIDIDPGLFLRR